MKTTSHIFKFENHIGWFISWWTMVHVKRVMMVYGLIQGKIRTVICWHFVSFISSRFRFHNLGRGFQDFYFLQWSLGLIWLPKEIYFSRNQHLWNNFLKIFRNTWTPWSTMVDTRLKFAPQGIVFDSSLCFAWITCVSLVCL